MSTIVFPDRAASRNSPAQQALARAAAAAAKAPSLVRFHALRWRVAGDRAELALRVEPPEPMMVIDGGSALHHALVALAGQGAVAACERFTDISAGKPIAGVHVTGFAEPTPEQVRAYQVISLPLPSARPGQPAVTSQAVDALQRAAMECGRRDVLRGVLAADQGGVRGWLLVGEALSAMTLVGAMERLSVRAYPASGDGLGTVSIEVGIPGR